MRRCKFWTAALVAVLLLPNVATSADAAKEACEKGKACFDRGDYDGAIVACSEVIKLDPKNAYAFFLRGRAYGRKGETAKAEEDFAQAKKLGYKAP